jgi:hypothetical protein
MTPEENAVIEAARAWYRNRESCNGRMLAILESDLWSATSKLVSDEICMAYYTPFGPVKIKGNDEATVWLVSRVNLDAKFANAIDQHVIDDLKEKARKFNMAMYRDGIRDMPSTEQEEK